MSCLELHLIRPASGAGVWTWQRICNVAGPLTLILGVSHLNDLFTESQPNALAAEPSSINR
eukprot:5295066-Amphidinium_carterae.1